LSEKISYIEFNDFDDLVRLISISPSPFLHHIVINGRNVYFIQAIGFGGGRTIYYKECNDLIKGRYVILNRFKDEVYPSDKIISDGQNVCIKILDLKRTNIFLEYPPK
jgi:hypothetical protein